MPLKFTINPGWRIILNDLALDSGVILRRAGLPADLFTRHDASLDSEQYFRLWRAVDEETNDPVLPLTIGTSISVETFDPPIFAALCSPNLNVALQRIGRYKQLVCPMELTVDRTPDETVLRFEWLQTDLLPPLILVATEVVYFVQLARIATRKRICPAQVTTPCALEPVAAYMEFLGVRPAVSQQLSISFRAEDTTHPFLTANERMWEFFEPELRERLSNLKDHATTAERVQALLLELIPSGITSVQAVSSRLAISTRTLQRRLAQDGTSFQTLLSRTREKLALHYLTHSSMSGSEIAFLLGYDNPTSFFRAFTAWTGRPPSETRQRRR